MKEFSNLDFARAKAAQDVQHILMCPSDLDLAHAIEHNIIGNHEYRREDIRNANRIYDKSEAMLKGKVVKHKSKLPREDEVLPLPKYIMNKLENITLAIDVMHVNGVAFLVSKSIHIRYYQAIPLSMKDKDNIWDALKFMMSEYSQRGGAMKHVIGDPAFECLRKDLNKKKIKLTTCDADRHFHQVKRCIRELKERIRCCRALMRYEFIPSRFVR